MPLLWANVGLFLVLLAVKLIAKFVGVYLSFFHPHPALEALGSEIEPERLAVAEPDPGQAADGR